MEGSAKLDLVPDPTKDAAGIVRLECFLCGHAIRDLSTYLTFGLKPAAAFPQLPAHSSCLQATPIDMIVREYRARVADAIGVRRPT